MYSLAHTANFGTVLRCLVFGFGGLVLFAGKQSALAQDQPQSPAAGSPESAQKAQQIAEEKAKAEQTRIAEAKINTKAMLSSKSLAYKYSVFQYVREQRPNSLGIVTLPDGTQVSAATVRGVVQADQLIEPFGAVFDLLGSFSDAGSGAYPSAQTGIQTEALGRVEWESTHYGYRNSVDLKNQVVGFDRKLDFSFGGSVGLYPALVLENLSSTSTTIDQPNARPLFQDAFQWTIGPRVNYPLFDHGEATAYLNVGQNFLINQVTSFKEGDNTVTAIPVSNGVGRTATFGEAGLEAKILSSPIWQAHDNKYDNLRPLFLVAAGVRKDTRFSRSGDLASYDHPQARFLFRFFINLTNIIAYNDEVKKAPPASLRFGVELERGLLDQRIPAATRFFVSADFNVMQVFKPSSQGQ